MFKLGGGGTASQLLGNMQPSGSSGVADDVPTGFCFCRRSIALALVRLLLSAGRDQPGELGPWLPITVPWRLAETAFR